MINYPLIEICIDKIEQKYNKVFTSYQELSQLIRTELKEDISTEEVLDYYENYYCCDSVDIKLILKHTQ